MGLNVSKPVFGEVANNKGPDQPAHTPSLITTFGIRFLGSIKCKLATGEISLFYLVIVAEESGLKHRQVVLQRGPYVLVV